MPYSYGNGPFGGNVAPIQVPQNRFSQVQQLPAYASLSPAATGVIQSQLSGRPSASTVSALTSAAAARGVGRGMPGATDFTNNDLFGNIAGYSENLQNQGVQNYNTYLNTALSGMTDPNLAAEVAGTNASNAAAPDPTQAAGYARNLFEEYLSKFNLPSGGTGRFLNGGSTPPMGGGGSVTGLKSSYLGDIQPINRTSATSFGGLGSFANSGGGSTGGFSGLGYGPSGGYGRSGSQNFDIQALLDSLYGSSQPQTLDQYDSYNSQYNDPGFGQGDYNFDWGD